MTELRAPQPFDLTSTRLLQPGGLAVPDLERVFGLVMSRGVDRADLYF